jgi:hypothetical protein
MLTRPEPLEILQRFYKTAKPIGLWGPVRRSLDAQAQEAVRPEIRRDVMTSALGILFYLLLTVSLFSLLGGHCRQGLFALILAAVLGVLFAKTAISRLKPMGSAPPVPEPVNIEH